MIKKITSRCRFILPLMAALCVLVPAQSEAATYFVATWGNDGSSGTAAAPYRTIRQAVSRVSPGDTIQVRGGIYSESVLFSKSGTQYAPIRLMAYPGESPIIDGYNGIPGQWGSLLHITGNYVIVDGFEVRNSAQYGVHLQGHHNAAQNLNVHHIYLQGILARGDYSLVENCTVWESARRNYQGAVASTRAWDSALSAARDPVDGITNNAVLRGNISYNNWGEGLSSFEASGTLIENNIVYDNWAVNLYISDTTNAVVNANLVYTTPNNPTGRRSCGICLADETLKNPINNIVITNNLVYQAGGNLKWWSGYANSGLQNVLIAHNTFVNTLSGTTIGIDYGNHGNVNFTNNIVRQDDGLAIAWVDGRNTGVNFNNNLWSKAPSAKASAWNDVVANPQLVQAGGTGAGQLSGEWFKLQSYSPARDRGVMVSSVVDDFYGNTRSSTPDIGAIEFGGATSTPPSTPTPPPATPSPSGNLALNRPATASTFENGSYSADKAFDGNQQTRWSSQFADPQWIYVDLGGQYNVNRVRLIWEAAYSGAFQIQVSSDRVNWTTIQTVTGTGGTQDLAGLAGSGQYVRIYSTQRATRWGNSLWEFEVYGTPATAAAPTTNLALNKPVTASTIESSAHQAQYLVDGNTGTRWSSRFWDPQWISVDLGAVYNISRVKLLWETAYAQSYSIEVSNDGGNWTSLYSTDNGVGGTVDLNSISGVGRYIRMYGDGRATGWGYSLWEMEVYGTPWQ